MTDPYPISYLCNRNHDSTDNLFTRPPQSGQHKTNLSMSIKIKAVERLLKVGAHAGEYRYMLQADLYNKLSQSKVIQEAALRSGISKGSMSAAWDAIGEVI